MSEMKCKRCGTDESRIDGFCSIECRDAFDYEEEIAELQDANTELHSRIAELEEKQRWRVVADGELPEVYRDEDGDFIPFLVCEGDGGYPFIARYNGINWWAGIFVPDITHWMPLPPNPESPNDTQTQTIVYGKESEK